MKNFIILSSIVLASSCLASPQEDEKQPKPITIYPGESQRIEDQKKAGILKGDRNYSEESGKSEFVKNRDRATGTVEKVAKDVKNTFKKLK